MAAKKKPTPAPEAMTIELSARTFRELVHPLIVFALDDDVMPTLNVVRVQTDEGIIYASATDRFKAGFRRATFDGPTGFDALIPLDVVRKILSIFRVTRGADPKLTLTLSTPDGRPELTVAGRDAHWAFFNASLTFPLQQSGTFPDVKSLIERGIADRGDPVEGVGLNPVYLNDFAKAARRNEPMTVIMPSSPVKPVLVVIADHFIGLLMPVRTQTHPEKLLDPAWSKVFTSPKAAV